MLHNKETEGARPEIDKRETSEIVHKADIHSSLKERFELFLKENNLKIRHRKGYGGKERYIYEFVEKVI